MRIKVIVVGVETREDGEYVLFATLCHNQDRGDALVDRTPSYDIPILITNPSQFGKYVTGSTHYIEVTKA